MNPLIPPRWILHVDMDAFYASIEQRDHPEYRGKPVIVGSPPNKRGVVATCSYEARIFGVRSAMPSRTAGKLCPQGIFLPPNMEKYRKESRRVMAILRNFSPELELVSVDEAFLDVSHVGQLLGNPVKLARQIKERIRQECGLTASVGVAPNKFLAKLASDLEKPDGLTLITNESKESVLAPLPVGKLWGVGKVMQQRLQDRGFNTAGDLQKADMKQLAAVVGNQAPFLIQLAFGLDDRPMETRDETKSIGSETTFDKDTGDMMLLRKTLFVQAEEVASDLRKTGVAARKVTLKLRYADFTTITRQTTLDPPTQDEVVIHNMVVKLMENEELKGRKIRLIGLSTGNLVAPRLQMDLFDSSGEKRQQLAKAVDDIRAKLGRKAIQRLGD